MTTVSNTYAERQRRLGHVRVHDVMHQGIIGVTPETPIVAVAEVMASRRVHAVAVQTPGGPWKIVSALDVVTASVADGEPNAGQIAAMEVLTISADERLDHAAQLMAEHELSHLIVVEPASGHPAGVLSTLDLVGALAG